MTTTLERVRDVERRDLADVEFNLIRSVDDVLRFREWLGRRRSYDAIAVDTEASGLSPERDRVRLIQFGDANAGWVIDREEWLGVARDTLRVFTGNVIMHNMSYDVAMLRESCGITIPRHRVEDTRLLAHVLDSTGSVALKNCSARYVDARAATGQRALHEGMKANGWTWGTVPIDFTPYWLYAALDTVLTYRLFEEIWPRVQEEAPRSYELEAATSWVTERMERNGVKIDRSYVASQVRRLTRFVEESERWCRSEYNVRPGSNAAIVEVLQREGVDLTKRTKGGAVSLDKEVLAGIDHPLAQTVLRRRQAQKLVGTYFENFLEFADDDDVIHPHINVIGGYGKTAGEAGGGKAVRTGRMSCDSPNFQNVPIRTKEGKMVRDTIITRYAESHDDRWNTHGSLMMWDFNQIEARILAHLSRDPGLISAFTSEGDFFVNVARQIYDDPNLERDDPRRQTAKNSVYAINYGAGVTKFAMTAGIPEAEAQAVFHRFHSSFPGVRRMQRQVESVALQRQAAEGTAYVRSFLTHRRLAADRGKEYALINYLIQGTAAELLKMKLVELDQAGLGEYLVLPVHDEVIADVPDTDFEAARTTFHDVMNDDTLLSVPVTADGSRGMRWGSKEEM